jgi:hypothetical protein
MREPKVEFLVSLAAAMREAEHRNIVGHFVAGLLWCMYPEWYDKHFRRVQPDVEALLAKEYKAKFGAA